MLQIIKMLGKWDKDWGGDNKCIPLFFLVRENRAMANDNSMKPCCAFW